MLAVAAACSDPPPERPQPTPPRAVELSQVAEDELVALVLEECHGLLRGTMSNVHAVVTAADAAPLHCYSRLPGAIRVTGDDGVFVMRGEVAEAAGAAPRALTAAELERVRALRDLLDIATLGPLYRATSCRRSDAARFELTQPDGAIVSLELRPGTLLPETIQGAFGTITIDDYVRTPVTWIVARANHPTLGDCRIAFEGAGIRFEDGFFSAASRPRTDATANGGIKMTAQPVETRSPTPILVAARALRWLVLDDPGNWAERTILYQPLHLALDDQEQAIAGFAILTRVEDRDVFIVPFRPRQGDAMPAVVAGREVRILEVGRELVVFPPRGDLATRRAEGERLLHGAIREHGLEAAGPICCQPYFHLDEAAPTAAGLLDPVVRMSVRIR